MTPRIDDTRAGRRRPARALAALLVGCWLGACGATAGTGASGGTDAHRADTATPDDIGPEALGDTRTADEAASGDARPGGPGDDRDATGAEDADPALDEGTGAEPQSEVVPVETTAEVSPAATLAFVEPASPCTNPVTMRVTTTGPIARVAYDADGWSLGTATDAADGFALTYTFQQAGQRLLHAVGQAADGSPLAEAWRTVVVEPLGPGDPDVPYFYQYDNELYPGSTCQNTSVAMLLAWLGWPGEPDDITAAWGKDHAQEPSGLAEVFNSYAADFGLPQRLEARTDGTVDDVRALLAAGRPVIVHGYFTTYGHVMVTLGFDGTSYVANDPAGRWAETFMGGYPYAADPTAGHAIAYDATAFDAAIATSDGRAFLPVWYHELLGPVPPEVP